MRSTILTGLLFMTSFLQAQVAPAISESEVSRIEKTLSADNMQGRQVFTPGIETAAAFIAKEFSEAGLKPIPGSKDFSQHFNMYQPQTTDVVASIDGISMEAGKVVVFSADTLLTITAGSHYKTVFVKKGDDYRAAFFKYFESDENVIIFLDTSFARSFTALANYFRNNHTPQFENCGNRIFILSPVIPTQYDIQVRQILVKKSLTNLAGILPGKSKSTEMVIFSAHYDHLGIGKPNESGDSIYNGANDDASGTTAVITLAKYFGKKNNNERTIVFVAFTAEEVGEFGSAFFSKKMNSDQVVAMFNIEMIGTESKWGKNSAYITGYDKSDMGTILQKNLVNTPFKFYPDPYPQENLFLRSDNAQLAKLGVPAHTISTSKMDSEKFYHQLGDEIGTLDMINMTEIIRSIGISAGSIISGRDTPTRVVPY